MATNYWQNKICVVTGATAGLGLSVVHALAKSGAKLVLVARNQDRLVQIAANLNGVDVITISADVTRQTDVDNLAKQVLEKFGKIDFLCNCAGKSTRGTALDTPIDSIQELLDLNFLAAVRTSQAFAPSLISTRGHLVNIGSLASKVAPRYLAGYPASKFALAAFSQQLRLELGPQGLHVLLVCPGPIQREDASTRYASASSGLPDTAQQPGAGAKLRGIDPDWLAAKILRACESRKLELVVPWKVRVLLALAQVSPKMGDWLLLRATSSSES